METYMAKEVEFSTNRKRKQEVEGDDIQEPKEELKYKKLLIDFKVEAGGTIMNSSQWQNTRSRIEGRNERLSTFITTSW
jgi:hypothetical protein